VGAGFMPVRPDGVRLFLPETCTYRRTRSAEADAYISSHVPFKGGRNTRPLLQSLQRLRLFGRRWLHPFLFRLPDPVAPRSTGRCGECLFPRWVRSVAVGESPPWWLRSSLDSGQAATRAASVPHAIP